MYMLFGRYSQYLGTCFHFMYYLDTPYGNGICDESKTISSSTWKQHKILILIMYVYKDLDSILQRCINMEATPQAGILVAQQSGVLLARINGSGVVRPGTRDRI
jgi:hypothetical protein